MSEVMVLNEVKRCWLSWWQNFQTHLIRWHIGFWYFKYLRRISGFANKKPNAQKLSQGWCLTSQTRWQPSPVGNAWVTASVTSMRLAQPVNTVCEVYGVLPIRFFHDIGHIGKTSKLNHYAWSDHYAWGEYHAWCNHYTYDKYYHCERSRKA